MNRSGGFTAKEIVGLAAVAATALGGGVIALTRTVDRSSRTTDSFVDGILESLNSDRSDTQLHAARDLVHRLASNYPQIRHELAVVAARRSEDLANQSNAVSSRVADRLLAAWPPDATEAIATAGIVDQLRQRGKFSPSTLTDDVTGALARRRVGSSSRLRETLTSLAILAATSAAIYAILGSGERRERIKNTLCNALEYGHLLMDDVRDYDEGYL